MPHFLIIIIIIIIIIIKGNTVSQPRYVNPLSANFTKWSTTLKQFVGKLG